MSKAKALPDEQEAILESLMKDIGSASLSLPDALRKAMNEGARIGARESRLLLAQQLQGVLGVPMSPLAPRRDLPQAVQEGGGAAIQHVSKASAGAEQPSKKKDQCPVPNCKEPGVRQFHNFCQKHFSSLSEDEKKKELRARQLMARRPPARNAVTCPVPKCTNTGVRNMYNFCAKHYASLSDEKKMELRGKQLMEHKQARKQQQLEAAGGLTGPGLPTRAGRRPPAAK